MPPASKCEHRVNPVLQKKCYAEPRQKQKHRHTVIDPRHATTLTAFINLRGIRSVLRECDRIRVVQQNASG
jgi:hypothetical protein